MMSSTVNTTPSPDLIQAQANWMQETILELAMYDLQFKFEPSINRRVADHYVEKGHLSKVTANQVRGKVIVYRPNEVATDKDHYVCLQNDKEHQKHIYFSVRNQAQKLLAQVQETVLEAARKRVPPKFGKLEPWQYRLAEGWLQEFQAAYKAKLREYRDLISEDKLSENDLQAKLDEIRSRGRLFMHTKSFAEQSSSTDTLRMSNGEEGELTMAQGPRPYMEDRATCFSVAIDKELPRQSYLRLLSILSMRLTKYCLDDKRTHNNGSTTVLSLVNGDDLYAKCVGDSVIDIVYQDDNDQWKCRRITWEQKPSATLEKSRITSEGGLVTGHYPHERINTGLGVSRSHGHHGQTTQFKGVSSLPELVHVNLAGMKNVHTLLASDGLFDTVTETDIEADLNAHGLGPGFSGRMARLARAKGSSDNIAVLVTPCKDGCVSALCDGHGYPQQGHITSDLINSLYKETAKEILENPEQYIGQFDQLCARDLTPPSSLSPALERDQEDLQTHSTQSTQENDDAALPMAQKKRRKIQCKSTSPVKSKPIDAPASLPMASSLLSHSGETMFLGTSSSQPPAFEHINSQQRKRLYRGESEVQITKFFWEARACSPQGETGSELRLSGSIEIVK